MVNVRRIMESCTRDVPNSILPRLLGIMSDSVREVEMAKRSREQTNPPKRLRLGVRQLIAFAFVRHKTRADAIFLTQANQCLVLFAELIGGFPRALDGNLVGPSLKCRTTWACFMACPKLCSVSRGLFNSKEEKARFRPTWSQSMAHVVLQAHVVPDFKDEPANTLISCPPILLNNPGRIREQYQALASVYSDFCGCSGYCVG